MFQVLDVFPEILFDISDYNGDSIYELGEVFANSPIVIQGYVYNIENQDIDFELYYDRNGNRRFDSGDGDAIAFSENSGTNPESIEYLAEESGLYYARIYNFDQTSITPPNFSVLGVLPENIISVNRTNTATSTFNIEGNNSDFPFEDVTFVEYQFPADGNIRTRVSSNSFEPGLDVYAIDDSNENGILDVEDEILDYTFIVKDNSSSELSFSVLEGSGFLAIDNLSGFGSSITIETSYGNNNSALTLEQGTAQIAYVAYYGRPADPGGLAYWDNRLGEEGISYSPRGGDLLTGSQERNSYRGIVNGFGNSGEANRVFDGLSNRQKVNQVYNFAFGRNGDSEGLSYWTGQLNQGNVNLTTFALEVALGAQNQDLEVLQNKIDSANLFSQGVSTNPQGGDYSGSRGEIFGRDWLFDYGNTVATIGDVNNAINSIA